MPMPDRLTILHEYEADGSVTWPVIDEDGNVVRSFDRLAEAEAFVLGEGDE